MFGGLSLLVRGVMEGSEGGVKDLCGGQLRSVRKAMDPRNILKLLSKEMKKKFGVKNYNESASKNLYKLLKRYKFTEQ